MIPSHIAHWALKREREKNDHRSVMHAAVGFGTPDERKPRRQEVLPPATEQTEPRVLEFGGDGGSPPPPQQPSPMEQAQAKDWENQQEFEREERRRAAEKEAAAAEKAAADEKWSSGRSGALERARGYSRSRLGSMGMSDDPYGIGSLYGQRLDASNAALQVGDDYTSAFSPTVFDEVLSETRGNQRNKLKTAYGGAIDPYYAEDLFNATSDDAILASILGTQYDDALSDINNAFTRGQINSAAQARAIRDLDTARTTANADLQNIGAGVRRSAIDAINERRAAGLTSAGEWDFGSEFDPLKEAGRVKSFGQERFGGLEGELRGAAGKQYFDPAGLMGKAKAKIGDQTTPTTAPTGLDALAATFKDQATKQQEGVF